MQPVVKDRSYHESAVRYNEGLYEFATELAESIEHPEPKRWCLAVAKQHKFHLGRHQRALRKLEGQDANAVVDTEDGGEDSVIVDDERIVHRSAVSGQFVTENEAVENPDATVEETIDAPRAAGDALRPFEAVPGPAQPVDAAPDSSLAAESVEADPSGPEAVVETPKDETEDEKNARLFAQAQADAEAAKKAGSNDD